jgi:hypothetical protein
VALQSSGVDDFHVAGINCADSRSEAYAKMIAGDDGKSMSPLRGFSALA